MSVPEYLQKIFRYIDSNKKQYIDDLQEAVSIQSVSCLSENRDEILKMISWVDARLQQLGFQTELHELGNQVMHPDDSSIKRPPALLGTLITAPERKTVLIYGHLDVQPANKSDGWDTEPFELTEKDGKLYGRGSTDNKGPVLAWLHAFDAYQSTNLDIPVNLKVVFESMEECGSEGLQEFLLKKKDTFLKDVDYVVISDNCWLGNQKPCLTYGLRGLCFFSVEVQCAKKDLHSGSNGGIIPEALTDLVYLLDSLVDRDGMILVPGIYDDVQKVGLTEDSLYKNIDFDVGEFKKYTGVKKLLHKEDKVKLLQHLWRFPSLSLHGIEGAHVASGCRTVIPAKVLGKFSIHIVPNQTPEKVEKLVVDYLNKKWKERASGNSMTMKMDHSSFPWLTDPLNRHFEAGRKAVQYVYGVEPDLTRDGGSIPAAITFQDATWKSVIMLPLGTGCDGAHSQNEKMDVQNYIEGTKLLAAYIFEVAQL